jgi:hypothetical protein
MGPARFEVRVNEGQRATSCFGEATGVLVTSHLKVVARQRLGARTRASDRQATHGRLLASAVHLSVPPGAIASNT